MKRAIINFALFAAASAALAVLAFSQDAEALGQPLTGLHAEVLSVTTTAERVTSESGVTTGWKSCTIWNNSATPLHVGGPTVDSTDGFPICTDTAACPAATITIDARSAYVISSSGTLTPNLLCGR